MMEQKIYRHCNCNNEDEYNQHKPSIEEWKLHFTGRCHNCGIPVNANNPYYCEVCDKLKKGGISK